MQAGSSRNTANGSAAGTARPGRPGRHDRLTGAPPRPRRAPTKADRVPQHPTAEIDLIESLSDAARDMHGSLSQDAVLRVAAEQARQLVGATQAATTRTVDRAGSQQVTAVATNGHLEGGVSSEELLPPADWAAYRRVTRSNQPLRLDGPALRTLGTDHGPRRSWLGAPLVGSDGRNLGLLQVVDRVDDQPFSAGDEAVIVQLARMASVAIENARLYEAALDARSQLAWSARIERVRAAELRAVIEAMGEAILVCDAEGLVRLSNPAADRLFDGRPVSSFEDLLSRFEWPSATGPDLDPTDETPGGLVELRLRGDEERWVELRVSPVPDAARAGDGAGRIAVMRDVSRARQARAQRDTFLGILSHELRTPITTIYAGSKVLARTDPDDGSSVRRELAADVAAEAERLFRLVEDLLVMTRVERGGLQLASEPVLLQRVLTGAIRLEAGHWPDAKFRLHGSSDVPAVAGDATYVEQVARNLLSNAAKYSPANSTVDVHLEVNEGEVIVRVLDDGPGFSSGEAQDLFELFYRSPATAAQASGAGIGLFVCRRLIIAMGGRIWGRPRPSGGAEFGFALRLYGEED
jgi:K+-sensing histidine kinase KdpD